MRAKVIITAILASIAATLAVSAPAASAESSTSAYSSRLVTLINQARAQHGLRALAVASGTTQVAATWTAHMAATNTLAHNPNLRSQLESHGSSNWTTYGENVGEGPASSADKLFTAYMNSPEHRANILDGSYRYLGIASVFAGDLAWNTMDFVDAYGSTTTTRTTTTTVHHSAPAPVTHHATIAPVKHAAPRPAAKPAAHLPHRTVAARPVAPAQQTHVLRDRAERPVSDVLLASGVHPTLPGGNDAGTTVRLLLTLLAAAMAGFSAVAWFTRRRVGA